MTIPLSFTVCELVSGRLVRMCWSGHDERRFVNQRLHDIELPFDIREVGRPGQRKALQRGIPGGSKFLVCPMWIVAMQAWSY